MNTDTQLRTQLERIHRKSYPAYKDLRGSYQFPGYILHIDHVQGDPFAAPSKVSVEVSQKTAGFPGELFDRKYKRIALQDHLTRIFGKCMSDYMFQAKGSGKSGLMSISRCGQQVLERTALEMNEKRIIVRFEVGFPANGRSINAPELEKILFRFVPECVKKSLYYKNLDPRKIRDVVNLAEDQQMIREELKKRDLVAFVANGSVLPRESGVSDKPMRGAIAFESPKTMEVELTLPHKGKVKGMGIPRGITLIVGGGYHGKSTLLKALELGVYNHIAGDGREYVITDDTAMKIRAEDGRAVSHVNISPFINHLPNGKDTVDFSTEDASGSTSQAANVVEAVDSGAGALLIDEDTSATNFMVRDALMQSVIAKEKEPITPFIDQARSLYQQQGVSVILVAGSSGAYFYIADKIIQMDTYRALDITERVKEVCRDSGIRQVGIKGMPAVSWKQTGRMLSVGRIEKKHDQIKTKQFGKDSFSIGKDTVELKYVEQIADSEQTTTLSHALKYIAEQLERNPKQEIERLLEHVCQRLEKDGPGALSRGSVSGNLASVRRQEIYACINRYRGFRR
ncbi:MAG: ABC-ATPase domain-containing protein [Eubacteriales bacterium]|nr:ABC-ATPase domain-containing protein [Eubacteriales bacterium]